MLSSLADLLTAVIAPLNSMGQTMALNASTYATAAAASGAGSKTMATHAFNVFAGSWIDALGSIAVATGAFLTDLVTFLQGITGTL